MELIFEEIFEYGRKLAKNLNCRMEMIIEKT